MGFGDRLAAQAEALEHARRRAAAEVLLLQLRASGATVVLKGDLVNVKNYTPSPQAVERLKALKDVLLEILAADVQ